jgi:hypothetical protein
MGNTIENFLVDNLQVTVDVLKDRLKGSEKGLRVNGEPYNLTDAVPEEESLIRVGRHLFLLRDAGLLQLTEGGW